jgi:hypothetical protein
LVSRGMLAVVTLMLCCACSPPTVSRPLDGARPIGAGGAQASGPATSGPPPTLSPSSPSPTPSPDPGSSSAALPEPSPSPPPEAGYFIAATDGRGVNLRDGPSTSARVIVTLAEGTAVEVFGDAVPGAGGPWRKIRSGSREGWVVAGVLRRR